jgi:phage baseplate assembly protein W
MAIIKKIGYRIDPLDLDTRKAIGVKVPFNKKNIFDFNYTTKDQIKSNLINLLLTSPGERFHEPTYGVGLRDQLFEVNDDSGEGKIAKLKQLINQKIGTHIPQIRLNSLKVSPIDDTNNLVISLNYTVLLDNDTNQISIQL